MLIKKTSPFYALIATLPVTIVQLNLRESLNATSMVDTFTKLFGICSWSLDPIFNCDQAVKFVVGNNSSTYHAKLKLLAKQFLNEVNRFCNDTNAKTLG